MNTQDYNNELNIIKYIAQENRYQPKIIDTIVKRIAHTNTKCQEQIHHTNLPQHNKTHKIASTFQKLK